jgi:hypothetical protein
LHTSPDPLSDVRERVDLQAQRMPKTKKAADKVEVEPGADKRLENIFKKALNTPPKHVSAKRKDKSSSPSDPKSAGRRRQKPL